MHASRLFTPSDLENGLPFMSHLRSPMVSRFLRSDGGTARCGVACGAAAAADVG